MPSYSELSSYFDLSSKHFNEAVGPCLQRAPPLSMVVGSQADLQRSHEPSTQPLAFFQMPLTATNRQTEMQEKCLCPSSFKEVKYQVPFKGTASLHPQKIAL